MKYFLRRRVHSSWQIAAACGGILAGVTSAGSMIQIDSSFGWLLTGCFLVLIAAIKQQMVMIVLALIGGCLVGLWRGGIEQSGLKAYQPLYGKSIQLTGVVSDDADVDKHGQKVLRLKNIRVGTRQLSGQIWMSVAGKVVPERSDIVSVSGKLQKGFGTFAGSMYRATITKFERPNPGDVALHVRDWFAGSVRQAIPEPEASLGIGYLVGQRRALPEELDTALKVAGLTHIVVASGYNLTILVRLARRLFERVSKYLSALASGALIAGFIAVTGISPSMARAGLVASLSLLAWYYGRKFHPVVLLLFAGAVTVLINPSYAWGDVGWQLSFAAFGGVMILAPLLQAYYFGSKKPGIVRQILGETIAATVATLPILLYTFGYMSNVALFANLLILPLVPLAMLLTFIAGIGALLFSSIALVIGLPAYFLLQYMTQTAQYFAHLPWAITELKLELWHVIVIYAMLGIMIIYMWHKTKLNLRDANLVE